MGTILSAAQWAYANAAFIGLYFLLNHVIEFVEFLIIKALWNRGNEREKTEEENTARDLTLREGQRLANGQTADALLKMSETNGKLVVQIEAMRETIRDLREQRRAR